MRLSLTGTHLLGLIPCSSVQLITKSSNVLSSIRMARRDHLALMQIAGGTCVRRFSDASTSLCRALVACARRLATSYVDPDALSAFTACRLILLNKNPGVRPIGIGEVVRRIIGKAVLSVAGASVEELAGTVQLCVCQDCGIEAAVHAMSSVFGEEATEGLLLADASNAFNRLNRGVCLRNVRHLCPALAPILINTYRHPAPLYVGGECILSREGTTQGDPLALLTFPCILTYVLLCLWYIECYNVGALVSCLMIVERETRSCNLLL